MVGTWKQAKGPPPEGRGGTRHGPAVTPPGSGSRHGPWGRRMDLRTARRLPGEEEEAGEEVWRESLQPAESGRGVTPAGREVGRKY